MSKKASIKIYKKQDHYNKWEFVFDPNQNAANAMASTGATTGTGVNGSNGTGTGTGGFNNGSAGGGFNNGSSGKRFWVWSTVGPDSGPAMGQGSGPVTGLVLDPVMAAALDRATGPGLADRRPARLVLLRRPPTHPSRSISPRIDLRFGGQGSGVRGIPHLAKNERDVGHPKFHGTDKEQHLYSPTTTQLDHRRITTTNFPLVAGYGCPISRSFFARCGIPQRPDP